MYFTRTRKNNFFVMTHLVPRDKVPRTLSGVTAILRTSCVGLRPPPPLLRSCFFFKSPFAKNDFFQPKRAAKLFLGKLTEKCEKNINLDQSRTGRGENWLFSLYWHFSTVFRNKNMRKFGVAHEI